MKPDHFRQSFAILLFVVFLLPFFSCETHNFDSDNRQIKAKDEIRSKLHKISNYDITGFREDTVDAGENTTLKSEIRYRLDFQYVDSNNVLQKKTGYVFFAAGGVSILRSTITDK